MAATLGPKTASLFSRLNPIPGFPDYTGPYKVGTIDIEIPVTRLSRVSAGHNGPVSIHTILFRVFYPAVPEARGKRIPWLPTPQRQHVGAYAQFLGAGSTLASFLSFLPRHLHYASIPVHKNAALLRPDAEKTGPRWPTVVFSHGLGGNRNTYSHLAGSLASHGLVVFCPEHRDGSAPVSLIRIPQDKPRTPMFSPPTLTECRYVRIPHKSDPETWNMRNHQIRVRLWELGLVFDAISRIDKGDQGVISANMNTSTPQDAILRFVDQLDVQEPGRVIFAGHSFGAASMVQLLKSTYYADRPEIAKMAEPLFQPAEDSYIRKHITEKNPLILLDMWCFPLVSATAAPLYDLPLPAYDDVHSAPGGDAILAVESQHFFKWRDHLHAKARILSPDPTQRIVGSSAFERPNDIRLSKPNFFYVESSAHLSQSDFGVLFPWLTKRVFGAENPERCLRLNLRAQLQLLRNNGYRVASTWNGDMVDDTASEKQKLAEEDAIGLRDGVIDDKMIFDHGNDGEGPVDAWKWVDIVGLGEHSSPSEIELCGNVRTDSEERQRAEEDEREMEGVMEPSLDDSTAKVVKKEAAAAAGPVGTKG